MIQQTQQEMTLTSYRYAYKYFEPSQVSLL